MARGAVIAAPPAPPDVLGVRGVRRALDHRLRPDQHLQRGRARFRKRPGARVLPLRCALLGNPPRAPDMAGCQGAPDHLVADARLPWPEPAVRFFRWHLWLGSAGPRQLRYFSQEMPQFE